MQAGQLPSVQGEEIENIGSGFLLLNQGITHYNDCHSLAIRLASPSSLVQVAGVDMGCSLQHDPQGAGEA